MEPLIEDVDSAGGGERIGVDISTDMDGGD